MNLIKKIKYLLFPVIILTVLAGAYWILSQSGFIKSFQLAMQINEQTTLSSQDKKILEQLKEIIHLPKDATPTMAVITDAEKLKKQQPGFFYDAKNGDRLIVYPTKAIIYDYVKNKIINVGPVSFENKNGSL